MKEQSWKIIDDKYHMRVHLNFDGYKLTIEIYIKLFTNDPVIGLQYLISPSPRVDIINIREHKDFNSNSQAFTLLDSSTHPDYHHHENYIFSIWIEDPNALPQEKGTFYTEGHLYF